MSGPEKREAAIRWLQDEIRAIKRAPDINGCPMTKEWAEQLEIMGTCLEAVKAVGNATEMQPDCNEPLTLDKVWKMKGRPVVVKYVYGGPDTIGIVDVRFVHHLGEDKIRIVFASGYITVNEKDYGHYYNLYDYNPAHIDRDAWEPCDDCDSCRSCRYSDTDMDSYPCRICTDGNMKETSNFCPECGRPLTEEAWAELEKRLRG